MQSLQIVLFTKHAFQSSQIYLYIKFYSSIVVNNKIKTYFYQNNISNNIPLEQLAHTFILSQELCQWQSSNV